MLLISVNGGRPFLAPVLLAEAIRTGSRIEARTYSNGRIEIECAGFVIKIG